MEFDLLKNNRLKVFSWCIWLKKETEKNIKLIVYTFNPSILKIQNFNNYHYKSFGEYGFTGIKG
jgi:hypothetical protein